MAYCQRRTIQRKERLCSVCHAMCDVEYISCEQCGWLKHIACERIPNSKLQQYQILPSGMQYICRNCRCDANGKLDFKLAQQRLQKV